MKHSLSIALGLTLLARGAIAEAQTVAKEGTQPGGLAEGTPPAPTADKCVSCHSGGIDDSGALYRPFDTWGGTMMANAVRDPLFLAAVTVAEQDVAGSGQFCLRCHTPKGFVKGNATGIGQKLDLDDLEGVDCEACHRAINGGITQPAVTHGDELLPELAVIDPAAPYIGNARLIWDPRDVRHGPYADADSPAHAASANNFRSSSELCGQCHEVLSPTRTLHELDGTDTGFAYPLDTTYTEWKSSAYAKPGDSARSCIDCHMQRATGSALTLATFPSARARDAPRTHLLVGSNEWSVEAVMQANPELVLARPESFNAVKSATRNLLASALTIELSAAPVLAKATSVAVTIKVTNLSGHKFPTGYADGRRAFLQVELNDASGASLAIVGKYDAASQTLVEEPGLRIWEAVQAERQTDGQHHEWHIVKNDVVLKDTRIPPLAFAPAIGRDQRVTAPVSADYGSVGALRNYDEVVLQLANLAPLAAGAARITARVFFQSTTRAFIEELANANVTDQRGSDLKRIWQDTGYAAPRLVKAQTLDLQVLATGTGAGGGGANASGGSGSPSGGGAGASAASSGTANATSSDGSGCTMQRGASSKASPWLAVLCLLGLFAVRQRLRKARRKVAPRISKQSDPLD